MKSTLRSITAKLPELLAPVPYWPRTLRMICAAAPRWTLAWAILLMIQGILPVASVYLLKLSVDSLIAAKNSGGAWDQTRDALILLLFTAGVILLADVLQGVIDWIRTAQSELVQEHIKDLIHQQTATLDLPFYESPEYHDLMDQARGEGGSRPLALLESIGSFVQNSITLLVMAAVLFSYGPWLPFVLLISTLPAFYVVLRFERGHHRWWQQMTADRRWAQYFDTVLTHSDSAAEVRLFGLAKHFKSAYQSLRHRLITERLNRVRKLTVAKSLAGVTALLISGLTMAWMALRALHGHATLGDLALFYGAFNRGQSLMRSLLGSVSQIISSGLYLENLFAFLELKPQIVDPPQPTPAPLTLKKGISFRDVSFSYPGSQRAALRDFNLFIPAGKIVAIVGANGAGKTTLLKLLCRFYESDQGCIEMDGIKLHNLAVKELWQMLTVLFQFPVQYHATARQNIAFGNLLAAAKAGEIESAALRAGAREIIDRLPQGYDTILGRWFVNGAELSGGEWQRIALARAYVRRSPIIVLDEPTSLMDSWSEADWFHRFRELAKGRTAIVITHRFTIAMRADIIHVIDKGRIVESGTHNQLVSQDGLYAQSWITQMQASSTRHEELSDSEELFCEARI